MTFTITYQPAGNPKALPIRRIMESKSEDFVQRYAKANAARHGWNVVSIKRHRESPHRAQSDRYGRRSA